MPDWILTLVAVLVGSSTTILATYLTNRSAITREIAAREAEAAARRRERENDFQCSALIELQECVASLSRLTAKAYYIDVRASRDGENWREARLPTEIDEAFAETRRRLAILSSRVADRTIASVCDEIADFSGATSIARNQEQAFRALQNMIDKALMLNNLVGSALRKDIQR